MELKIRIEKTPDGYAAYAENVDGIYAMGDNVKEVKRSVEDAIETLKTLDGSNTPDFLNGDFSIVYKFDAESLLAFYKGVMGFSALEALTGIHQKQLQHYSTGYRKPRAEQRKKIEKGLHNFANDLLQVKL